MKLDASEVVLVPKNAATHQRKLLASTNKCPLTNSSE